MQVQCGVGQLCYWLCVVVDYVQGVDYSDFLVFVECFVQCWCQMFGLGVDFCCWVVEQVQGGQVFGEVVWIVVQVEYCFEGGEGQFVDVQSVFEWVFFDLFDQFVVVEDQFGLGFVE